jgi:uncharacterized protein YcaQ
MARAVALSKADARRLLTHHHFAPTDVAGVFERLGSVQYDPLKPVGCNHDLVLQARVPGYRVGDWERVTYRDRLVYDAWDKQACLVRMRDWPKRRIYHRWHERWWRERILDNHADAVGIVLDELRERGPLSSSQFEHQVHKPEWKGSWYGPKLTKHVLRALWHTGRVVTHHRRNGHHVYELSERIIPPELYHAEPPSERESVKWLILLRHQAVGLLRPAGNAYEVWSMEVKGPERKALIGELVHEGKLVPVEVDGRRYHAVPEVLARLDEPPLTPQMRFLAPLDQLMWDRKAVRELFDFDYVWEVYKPEKARKWGYYVLPVMHGERFVGRIDSKLEQGAWHVKGWWWEEDVAVDAELLEGLEQAASDFMCYLAAARLEVARGVDRQVRDALKAAAKGRA